MLHPWSQRNWPWSRANCLSNSVEVDFDYLQAEKHTSAVGCIAYCFHRLLRWRYEAQPLSSSIAGSSQRMLQLSADFWRNINLIGYCGSSRVPPYYARRGQPTFLDAPAFAPYDGSVRHGNGPDFFPSSAMRQRLRCRCGTGPRSWRYLIRLASRP